MQNVFPLKEQSTYIESIVSDLVNIKHTFAVQHDAKADIEYTLGTLQQVKVDKKSWGNLVVCGLTVISNKR